MFPYGRPHAPPSWGWVCRDSECDQAENPSFAVLGLIQGLCAKFYSLPTYFLL